MITIQRKTVSPQAYDWGQKLSSASIQTPYGTWYKAEGQAINQPFLVTVCKETPLKAGGKAVRKGAGPVAITIKTTSQVKGDFFKPITIIILRPRTENPVFSLNFFVTEFSLELSRNKLNSKFDELPWHKQSKIYGELKDTVLPDVERSLNNRLPNHTLSETDRCRALFIAKHLA